MEETAMLQCSFKSLFYFNIFLGTSLTVLVMVGLHQNDVEPSRLDPLPIPRFQKNCTNCSYIARHSTATANKTNLEPVIKTCSGCKKVQPAGQNKTTLPVSGSYNGSKKEPQKMSGLTQVTAPNNTTPAPVTDKCNGCSKVINKVLEHYALNWTKHKENHSKLRSQLSSKCNGSQNAIITQTITPLGTKLVYDGEKNKVLEVTQDVFSTFVKDNPFKSKAMDTCAVVGNGGILANSSCGEAIDSAQLVIRCNLPPLENDYNKHVGSKTDIVTANPSIFINKYGALKGCRRPFVDSIYIYGDALLLLPAFSYRINTGISLTVLYMIEDFNLPVRPVFINPGYLKRLDSFWRSQGLKAFRLSSGFMMVSSALEMCNNVDVYGFWPYNNHPYGHQPLTNHYYDNMRPNPGIHGMPAEFNLLLKLHSQGVLRLHLGQCPHQKQ